MSKQILFYHIEICTLLYAGNVSKAVQVAKETINKLSYDDDYKIYLTTLNNSIYNYILFKEKISLHQCCYDNHIAVQKTLKANMEAMGEQIVVSYGYCREYIIEKHKNQHIRKTIQYIHTHLSEPLSLDLLSQIININTCYLSDLFKKHVHCTFSEYVLIQRILLSKKLLASTSLPLSIISERCGFNNVSYFCTCFKKRVGVSPCCYRNQET